MVKCSKCGKRVLINLSNSYSIKGIPIVSRGSMKFSSVIFSVDNSTPVYECSSCGVIDKDDLLFLCRECNEHKPAKNMYINNYGSLSCDTCIERYELTGCKPFDNNIKLD